MLNLTPKELTADTFSQYGEVVDIDSSREKFSMNYGMATRYFNIADIDVAEQGGSTCISIVKSNAIALPFSPKVMEYHPLGSQLFYPLCDSAFLILVAPRSNTLDETKIELFISHGKQGVNYHKGVWHHYLMPLQNDSQFMVVDRKANDNNCVEAILSLDIILNL